jgi:hypothetical protein
MPSPQHRHIGPWTINNPTEEDFERVRSAVSNGHLNYVVFCHEIGETGTEKHLITGSCPSCAPSSSRDTIFLLCVNQYRLPVTPSLLAVPLSLLAVSQVHTTYKDTPKLQGLTR